MSDPLEAELRTAFAERLGTVSPEREARLCAFDYRSRARRHRRALAAVGTGGTALTGGVVAAVLLLSSGASVAEGWTPLPTTPSAAAVAAAAAACNWVHDRNGPILTGTPVLAEGRGSYTAAIYVNGHVTYTCISDGRRTATSVAMDDMSLFFDARPGPDQLGDWSGDGGDLPGFRESAASSRSDQVWDVDGLAGRDVSAVTFVFARGRTVEATVQHGWYFAWWPGDSWPSSVQVTTGSGTVTSPMGCRAKTASCVFAGRNSSRRAASTLAP